MQKSKFIVGICRNTQWKSYPNNPFVRIMASTFFSIPSVSSFLIQNYMENRQDLSSYSFASLFDRSLLNAYNPNPYQGMNGLFTYNFVKKSSYNAYVFLSRMGNEIQKQSDTYLLSASSNKIVLPLNKYNHYSDLFGDREYFEISNLNRYNASPNPPMWPTRCP